MIRGCQPSPGILSGILLLGVACSQPQPVPRTIPKPAATEPPKPAVESLRPEDRDPEARLGGEELTRLHKELEPLVEKISEYALSTVVTMMDIMTGAVDDEGFTCEKSIQTAMEYSQKGLEAGRKQLGPSANQLVELYWRYLDHVPPEDQEDLRKWLLDEAVKYMEQAVSKATANMDTEKLLGFLQKCPDGFQKVMREYKRHFDRFMKQLKLAPESA